MGQISTPHKTLASEMMTCGFDCVQRMNVFFAVFDHNRASPAHAPQSGWSVSWVRWHQCGFEAVDRGVPTSVPPILLSVFMVRWNDFLADAIWAEGTVGCLDPQVVETQTIMQIKIFYRRAMCAVRIMSTSEVPFFLSEIWEKNEGAVGFCLHGGFFHYFSPQRLCSLAQSM